MKLGLISAILLFLLVTAISLLLPSTINISRAININAPSDSVYIYLNNLAKWKEWFAGYDSLHTTFGNTTVGKGAMVTINKTTITITETNSQTIKSHWVSGSKVLESEFNFFRQNNSSLITVQWHFIQHTRWYPWEKFASIVSDKFMSPAMEKSLDNLKKVVEE
ncbi:MAG: SRPBCC family protein [Bacteroidota bacterium]|nr:SRPBCC family protein [Bacteroidota bacterium]